MDIFNKRYNMDRTVENVKDYNFKSINKKITKEEADDVFCCEEFWENVKVFDYALDVVGKYEILVCTCGTKQNIELKRAFLEKLFDKFELLPVYFEDGKTGKDKSMYDMSNSVQIDDNYNSLSETNAELKILFKNNNNFLWQNVPPNVENVYVANTWKEIEQILDWWCDKDGNQC